MTITVFELLNQFIYKKKLGSDVCIVHWSKLLWIEVFQQQNKTSWHNTLLHSTHGNLLYRDHARKACVTPGPNLDKSQKYAKVLVEFFSQESMRKALLLK